MLMKIGLAQTRFPSSMTDGLSAIAAMIEEAARQDCELVCFPESILPGLRGVGYDVEPYNHGRMRGAVEQVRKLAAECGIAVILPTEWEDELGLHLVAFVISGEGELLGYQTKNQIDPDEDRFGYVPGDGRRLFEVGGTKFGIAICHEGWRYPETVRWAAVRGASIVFHPMFTGAVTRPAFYAAAAACRSEENRIFFAPVNFALPVQGCPSGIVAPSGEWLCASEPGREQLLAYEIDPAEASGLLARRYRPELLR
ncbi:carbon-nitrogen hydrolase family protein [Paenibacillus xanthanilyticus]|uniref:Carbon-nitrogen hydrolase family protein n=1 Tax=Paenibacillus xanthanilyticus TaxID=1783531 RepID=A0ABV8JX30_9BACL